MHQSSSITDSKGLDTERNSLPKKPNLEIERKWLVRELPDLSKAEKIAVKQGYLASDPNGNEVRLRMRNQEELFLTVKAKSGNTSLVRKELELAIPKEQFDAMWSMVADKEVVKTRYKFQQDKHIFEVDVFEGRHAPLILVEVEFESESSSQLFTAPDWFGKEVTNDRQYKNASLALGK